MALVDQINKGKTAVMYFHNHSTAYPNYVDADGDVITMAELLATIGNEKTLPIQLSGLGDDIDLLNLNEGDVQSAMEALADKAQGKIPSVTAFFQALGGQAGTINYVDLVATVSGQTAVQIASGAASVGQSIIDTGKSLQVILPLAIVGAVLFIMWGKTKRLAA